MNRKALQTMVVAFFAAMLCAGPEFRVAYAQQMDPNMLDPDYRKFYLSCWNVNPHALQNEPSDRYIALVKQCANQRFEEFKRRNAALRAEGLQRAQQQTARKQQYVACLRDAGPDQARAMVCRQEFMAYMRNYFLRRPTQ
jgi:hypothetical protein